MAATFVPMRLLDAALPLVTSHGFTRAALLEASHSLSMPLSPQTLDGLFPAPSSAHDGPALALLRHWSAAQTQSTVQHLQSLKENNNNNNKVVGLVSAGFQRRLELNEPLKDRLPGAWSHRVFGRQLPDLRGFYRHAQGVSGSIAQAARLPDQDAPSTLQTSKLATIYAAAEWHQFSDASPNSRVTHQLLSALLHRDEKLSSAAVETSLFARHILKTWQGLAKSTYL